jgi:hypothetical protein
MPFLTAIRLRSGSSCFNAGAALPPRQSRIGLIRDTFSTLSETASGLGRPIWRA